MTRSPTAVAESGARLYSGLLDGCFRAAARMGLPAAQRLGLARHERFPVEANGSSFLGRHQFLIYRLFSLAGLIPIGAYIVVHLVTNSLVLDGPAAYQKAVNQIHSLGMILPVVEWVFIFIPILFHALVGFMIISRGDAQRRPPIRTMAISATRSSGRPA